MKQAYDAFAQAAKEIFIAEELKARMPALAAAVVKQREQDLTEISRRLLEEPDVRERAILRKERRAAIDALNYVESQNATLRNVLTDLEEALEQVPPRKPSKTEMEELFAGAPAQTLDDFVADVEAAIASGQFVPPGEEPANDDIDDGWKHGFDRAEYDAIYGTEKKTRSAGARL